MSGRARYQKVDLWAQRVAERGLLVQGYVGAGEEFVSEEELLASDWCREFLSTHDVFRLITSIVFDNSDAFPQQAQRESDKVGRDDD